MNGNFRVGEFLIEPQINTIIGAEKTSRIEPKVMQVLLCLVEHAGEVLLKEKLIQSVWPDTFVTDDVLTRSISELRKVFEDDAKDPRFIQTVPRSGYRLVAPISYDELGTERKDVPAPVDSNRRKRVFRAAVILGGALLLSVAAVYWFWYRKGPDPQQPSLTAIPLTTNPGWEGYPSLSPDGNHVAFASSGEQLGNLDIYVKLIGGGPPLRLTSDPAPDQSPAWSPDGRTIAFIRDRGDRLDVLLIPASGGAARKLAETADVQGEIGWITSNISWSTDGRYLVTTDRATPGEPPGQFVLSVATGEKRRLTTPPTSAVCDTDPAVSPDGRALAFIRRISIFNPELFVLPLSEDCQPMGEARRLDVPQPWVINPTWTPDGREIVCSAGQPWGGKARLWRISVSGSEKPQPLASVGDGGMQPIISRQGNRLVYAVWTGDTDIWRAELSGRHSSDSAVKLIASTRWESNPQYSPDGSRVVFDSDRSGHYEIWVCDGDGSNPVQLTSLESSSGTPRWFPDGRRIVFDSQKEGQGEIYVIDTASRVPRRLTNDPSDDVTPSVSRDGQWIYFASRRTGSSEIWRMASEGGEAVQVTHKGGSIPFESPDGKVVYYQKTAGDSDVWKVPVAGGEETRVLGPVGSFKFAVVADGIYFIEPGPPGFPRGLRENPLKFFSFAKGTAEKVFDIKYRPMIGLSVSPDGRYVLFSQIDPFVCDLMLVENFR